MLTAVLALTMTLAASVSAEAEADPQFFYYPTYPTYWQQPVYHYYPSAFQYHPVYYYPRTVSTTTVKKQDPEPVQTEQKKHHLRPIVPVFDYLRSGASQVTYLRPDEVSPSVPESDSNIVTYSVPYTQAYLNRVPATNYF